MTGYNDPVGYNTGLLLYNGAEVPDILLTVGGQDLSHLLTSRTLKVTDQVEERTVCRFHLADDEGLALEKGMQVHIRWLGARLFDGVIDDPTEDAINRGVLGWQVLCDDWTYLTDRRSISGGHTSTSVGAIVQHIVDNDLADDGVQQGTIQAGPDVSEVAYSWTPATKVLDLLAEAAGFTWYLDGLKRLHFHARGATTAPWSLDSQDDYAGMKVKNRNPNHRTRQVIRGGKAETASQSEQFTGDGVLKTFVVGFPIAREPTVTEDTVAQDVGVKGFGEEGARWLWARGSAELTLADGETPPAAGVDLEVTYKGLYDVVLTAVDQAEQVRVQELEGFGTGLVDDVETDTSITTTTMAAERAGALLQRYARAAREATFTTVREGLAAGQLLTVEIPQHRLDAAVLVTQVVASDRSGRLEYTVTAVDGPATGSWRKFFARFAEQTDPLSFRENLAEEETVIVLAQASEEFGWSEDTTVSVFTCDTSHATDDGFNDSAIGYADVVRYQGDVAELVTFPAATTGYADAAAGYNDPINVQGETAEPRPVVC